MKFRTFAEAREYVRRLGIKSQSEWRKKYCKSGHRPVDIPANPDSIYKRDWTSWGDFLGTGRIADQLKKYRSFNEARMHVMALGLKSQSEWKNYCKSGKKPEDIPVALHKTYQKDWTSWGDFLGTGRIADQYRGYPPFEKAKKFVHELGLKNQERWREYCKSNLKPSNIPSNPARTYKRE